MRCISGFVKRLRQRMRSCITFEFIEHARTLQLAAGARAISNNRCTPCRRVALVDQLCHWDFCKIRIAKKLSTIEEGSAKSFRREVNGFRRAVTCLREIETFKNIENFDQCSTAGRWGRRANDVVATIGALN